MIDITKPIETMDGKPVRYVGTIKETGNLLVAVTYPNIRGHILTNVKAHTALEIRFPSGGKFANSTSGDDLRNKVIEKTVWKNVYSDGTIGATEHESLIATWDYSKTKKTRVAILQFVYRNGEFFSVKHVACTPYTRDPLA